MFINHYILFYFLLKKKVNNIKMKIIINLLIYCLKLKKIKK